MTEVALRIEPVRLAALDRHLHELGHVRLVRSEDGTFLECDVELAARATCVLARAGVRVATRCDVHVLGSGVVPALAAGLEAIAFPEVVDVITVRSLSVGEATARIARRRSLFRRRLDVDAIRRLLREIDRAFAWRRVVWAPPRLMRSHALRGVRPIVFDRAALADREERVGFASESALTRWLE